MAAKKKSSKQKFLVQTRIPDDAVSLLKQKAKADGRTMAAYVRWLILRDVEKDAK